jgi:hypothetical protein
MKCKECPWFCPDSSTYCSTLHEVIDPDEDICQEMEDFASRWLEGQKNVDGIGVVTVFFKDGTQKDFEYKDTCGARFNNDNECIYFKVDESTPVSLDQIKSVIIYPKCP